ncbi:MAG: Zn-dependent hydrolase [Subtercola sp.]|nr:Zn-dependent hydrolase [Subtercola sp.]
MTRPVAETIVNFSGTARRVLAPNPSPARLEGTNSFLLQAPGSRSVVVVDPGPSDSAHLDRLCSAGRVELILITHRHSDHVEAMNELADRTGAPVRAKAGEFCRDADPLGDGEVIRAAGIRILSLDTPGHTGDSVCFQLPDDRVVVPGGGEFGVVLTGDTVLGRGSTAISPHGGGTIGDFLRSLKKLERLGGMVGLPGHGSLIPDLAATCERQSLRRRERLTQMVAFLDGLGVPLSTDDETVALIVDHFNAGLDPALRRAAEASARAQLIHLVEENDAAQRALEES